ncbi:MAG: LysR substrate-binding domain-containing protein [Pseudomonadota bacterium]
MSRPLPPLNAIRYFEAAARYQSFRRAADELGVTQGAVSKQVALLEDTIGVRLFERDSGGVTLTLEGRELGLSIAPAFEILERSFERYNRTGPGSKRIRLATLASFAAAFLVPRFDRLTSGLPGVELELFTSDRVVDLAKEEADLSIRHGGGGWSGVVSKPLDRGMLVPVAAPGLLQRHRGADPNDELPRKARRIQVFLSDEWRTYAADRKLAGGLSPNPIVLEHFAVATSAALQGLGVALLPKLLICDHLSSGALLAFSDPVHWEQGFYLVQSGEEPQVPELTALVELLQHEVEDALAS